MLSKDLGWAFDFDQQEPWSRVAQINYQLSPEELIAQSLQRKLGQLDENGALVVQTGQYTGRCPQHRFIVRDALTSGQVDWNAINQPMDEAAFEGFWQEVMAYLEGKEVWMRDAWVGASELWRQRVRVVTELPWADLFVHHLFLPRQSALHEPYDWLVLHVPHFTRHTHDGKQPCIALHFTRRLILIAGTAYTGEIKKSLFTAMNYWLPQQGVLTMHCSANMDERGQTALFFGLSGTGKTTLSCSADRRLIGDDEHGWDEAGIFNLEGGCYAKCIHLNAETEPVIAAAIGAGTLVENMRFYPGTRRLNFADQSITENIRAAFPLDKVPHHVTDHSGPAPRWIFFLTCDAHGVLPPVARLTVPQAIYQFLSGYTAKVAGTEAGVVSPKATFSTCFGAPFMPLHPTIYARMLEQKIRQHGVSCWLINTGWMGGPYGVGQRIPLPVTRGILSAIFEGKLEGVPFVPHPAFGFEIPRYCPGVPDSWLQPGGSWDDPQAYQQATRQLVRAFQQNFERFAAQVSGAIRQASPVLPG
ncbi:MAG: phosphoenolpyruvate carboxykinase (ATP) [Thermoflavifilum sp.]|nr:phosphoenolpyruvate carboxykinase (ATP) [Thermoflavifilum sp.]